MDLNAIIWLGSIFILGAFVTIYLYNRRNKKEKKPKNLNNLSAKRGIDNYIKRLCRIKGFKVVQNVKLSSDKEESLIDLVVIGLFGVIAIQTRGFDEQIYAYESDKKWLNVNGESKTYFENLILVGENDKNALRKLFSQNDIYNINIYQLAIFDGKKTELYVPLNLPVILKKNLKKEFKKPIYNKTYNNVNINKIKELLEKYINK